MINVTGSDRPGPFQGPVRCLYLQGASAILFLYADEQQPSGWKRKTGKDDNVGHTAMAGNEDRTVINEYRFQQDGTDDFVAFGRSRDQETYTVHFIIQRATVLQLQPEEQGRTMGVDPFYQQPHLSIPIAEIPYALDIACNGLTIMPEEKFAERRGECRRSWCKLICFLIR